MNLIPTQDELNAVKWWHQIDLGNGIVTPGSCDPLPKLAMSKLPDRLTGMSVLDVGAWDGWWSFECERRGAKRVVALDKWDFTTGRAGFDLAKRILKSNVGAVQMDVHDILPSELGKFDLVLCLGALHHFENPLLALSRLRSVCKGLLILETHLDLEGTATPICAFYSGGEFYDDPTIVWGPNEPCVRGWLKRVGFPTSKRVGYSAKTWEGGGSRAVFHAY